MLAVAGVSISGTAQVLSDGYYRVQNTRTERYCVLADDKAYVDESASGAGTGSVNLEAIRTYRPFEKVVSNPGSIIKFTYSSKGKGYTLGAQGTDTYTMLRSHGEYYLTVNKNGNVYTASAYAKGFNIHLSDDDFDDINTGTYIEQWDTLAYMRPTGSKTQYWYITKVDASTDNYFGFKPTLAVNGKYYLPFYASFSFKKNSNGIKAYYVNGVKERTGVAKYSEITDDVLPASVPMIIETSSAEPAENKIDIVDETGNTPSGNLLTGVYFCSARDLLPWYDQPAMDHDVYTLNDSTTMRVLGVEDGELVLKKSKSKYIPANSFYLKVSADAADVIKFVDDATFDATVEPDPTTGIESVNAASDKASGVVYNLNGQRVSTTGIDNLPHGVYIYNGKKVVKK